MDNFFNVEIQEPTNLVSDDTIINSYKQSNIYRDILQNNPVKIDSLKTSLKLLSLYMILNKGTPIKLLLENLNMGEIIAKDDVINVLYTPNISDYKEILDYLIGNMPYLLTNMTNIDIISSKLDYFNNVDCNVLNNAINKLADETVEINLDYVNKFSNKISSPEQIVNKTVMAFNGTNIIEYLSPNTYLVGDVVNYITQENKTIPDVLEIVIVQDTIQSFLRDASNITKVIPHDNCNFINKVRLTIPDSYVEKLEVTNICSDSIKEHLYKIYIEYKCKMNECIRNSDKGFKKNAIANMCYNFCTFDNFCYKLGETDDELIMDEQLALVLRANDKYIVISFTKEDIKSFVFKSKAGNERTIISNLETKYFMSSIYTLKSDLISQSHYTPMLTLPCKTIETN
jgi:hypothetical protein